MKGEEAGRGAPLQQGSVPEGQSGDNDNVDVPQWGKEASNVCTISPPWLRVDS